MIIIIIIIITIMIILELPDGFRTDGVVTEVPQCPIVSVHGNFRQHCHASTFCKGGCSGNRVK